MPEGNWTRIFSAGSMQEAELVRGRLEEHGIAALLMSTGASMYPQLSEVGVYVVRQLAMRALHVINTPGEA